MTVRFADWRTLARSVAPLVGVRGSESETTAGRRDKRRGTPAPYVVVSVRFFDHSCTRRSAVHRPKSPQRLGFHGTIARIGSELP